jgi:hypothetical protein
VTLYTGAWRFINKINVGYKKGLVYRMGPFLYPTSILFTCKMRNEIERNRNVLFRIRFVSVNYVSFRWISFRILQVHVQGSGCERHLSLNFGKKLKRIKFRHNTWEFFIEIYFFCVSELSIDLFFKLPMNRYLAINIEHGW